MKYTDQDIFLALPDEQLMGLCIEREAAGEPHEGRVAVGTVILERVDNHDWEGKTIQEVILKPWQFSWTMEQGGKEYYAQSVAIADDFNVEIMKSKPLQECFDIAKGLIDGTIPRDPDLHAAHCCQYLNPVTAARTKDKWLASGMKIIKVIKNHSFFA
jgi:hypothetical protein